MAKVEIGYKPSTEDHGAMGLLADVRRLDPSFGPSDPPAGGRRPGESLPRLRAGASTLLGDPDRIRFRRDDKERAWPDWRPREQ